MSGRALTTAEVAATGEWIASVQLPSGMIPWFPGGHCDPWNHTEAAMALLLAGHRRQAERAFEWLEAAQLPDGSWCRYYLAEGVEDPRRDPNVGAYVATGAWWHYLSTGDPGFLDSFWPVVEGAIEFVLRLQQPGGEILWSMDPDGHLGRYALLTSTASIHHSLRCAVAIAETLGRERPEWELASDRVVEAIVHRPSAFAAKDRWAMDWYYPVLSGALQGEVAEQRITSRWSEFVMDGVGVRCVSDEPWVTAAETAECAMALDAIGMTDRAADLVAATRHMRDDDGSYWTGCVHPQCVRYPGGERTTYTAAAVVMADHALWGRGSTAGLFRGETLPEVVDVTAVSEHLSEG
ncbi:MAG: prenyltransferase [Actinomycetota bacterium]|nr:prenyltransferase [Actinomycetota bacterium]